MLQRRGSPGGGRQTRGDLRGAAANATVLYPRLRAAARSYLGGFGERACCVPRGQVESLGHCFIYRILEWLSAPDLLLLKLCCVFLDRVGPGAVHAIFAIFFWTLLLVSGLA